MKKLKIIRSGLLSKISYSIGIALIVASVITNVLPANKVSAHSNNVSGSSVCLNNGTRQVTWTVTNDYWSVATLTAVNRTITNIVVGAAVPANYGSISGVEIVDGSVTGTITLTITSRWAD